MAEPRKVLNKESSTRCASILHYLPLLKHGYPCAPQCISAITEKQYIISNIPTYYCCALRLDFFIGGGGGGGFFLDAGGGGGGCFLELLGSYEFDRVLLLDDLEMTRLPAGDPYDLAGDSPRS